MPDEIKYKIKSEADNRATVETRKEIEALKKEQTSAASSSKGLKAAHEAEARAIDDLKKGTKDLGGETDDLTEKSHKLSESQRELAHHAGELKLILQSIKAPLIGMGAAIGFALTQFELLPRLIQMAGDAIDWWTERLQDAFPKMFGYAGALKEINEYHRQSNTELRHNQAELDNYAKAIDRVTKRLRAENDEIERLKGLADQKADAMKRLEIAEIEASKKSEIEKERLRVGVEDRYEQEANARAALAERAKEERLQIARDKQAALVAGLKKSIAELSPQILDEDQTKTAQDKITSIEKELEASGHSIGYYLFAPDGQYSKDRAAAALKKGGIQQLEDSLKRSKKGTPVLAGLKDKLSGAEGALADLDDQLAAAKRDFPENDVQRQQVTSIDELTRKYGLFHQASQSLDTTRGQAAAAIVDEAKLRGQPVNPEVAKANAELANAVREQADFVALLAKELHLRTEAAKNNRDQHP